MSKVIVHIDLNAFFARAEEIKNPSLEGKAVAIGGTGRCGIVSTCSYKAREFGVHSGMPMFQAQKLCPNLIIKNVDFPYYHMLSTQFFNFVKKYTPLVEIASIDECFADFTNVIKDVKNVDAYFKNLQQQLYIKTKLKCSIGIGPTKFLAKMASDIKKPMGITVIRKKDISKILYPLPIKDFFGIGKKTYPALQEKGIQTIGDLACCINKNDEEINKILGSFLPTIKDWLSGNGDDEVSITLTDAKSVSRTTTLPHDTDDFTEISETLELLANEVADNAIQANQVGHTIQVLAKEPNFQTHLKSVSLEKPTNNHKQILKIVLDLYQKHFLGLNVRSVGVTLQNLKSLKNSAIQMTLFDYESHEEENSTRLLINDLNRKLHKPLLCRASEINKEEDDNENK